jgi:glycosyltransferase involved in cell wall biosynthesis
MQANSMALFSMRVVRRLIHDGNHFDLIDSHYVYPDGYAALMVAKELGIPLAVTARGTDINLYPHLPGIRRRVRKVLQEADAIVGVSQALVQRMIALGAPDGCCHLISNGVNLKAFRPIEGQMQGRPQPRLLVVGNLQPEKGLSLLLEALQILIGDYADVRLSIVGNGPEERQLKSKCIELGVQGHVDFIGPVPHDKLPRYYQEAGVLCLTSEREGCPNVVMEALATGRPVAAIPVGGVPELVQNGVNGFLSEDYSPAAMAGAISRVLEHFWDPYEIRSTVEGRSWETVADEIQEVFQRVLGV